MREVGFLEIWMFNAINKIDLNFAYVRFMGERDLQKFDMVYRNQDTNLAMWKDEIEKIEAKDIYNLF